MIQPNPPNSATLKINFFSPIVATKLGKFTVQIPSNSKGHVEFLSLTSDYSEAISERKVILNRFYPLT